MKVIPDIYIRPLIFLPAIRTLSAIFSILAAIRKVGRLTPRCVPIILRRSRNKTQCLLRKTALLSWATIRFFSSYGINDTDTIREIYELIISDPANYLKYYVGYVEMLELKKEFAAKEGKDFSQKNFHKAVLDVGPAPFNVLEKYIVK